MSNNCQDKNKVSPDMVLLMNRIPVLRFLKEPVRTLDDLYIKYPDGLSYGSFALVSPLNAESYFAEWKDISKKWYPINGNITSILEQTSSVLDIDFFGDNKGLKSLSKSKGQAIKINNIWTNIISSSTGENVNYKIVTTFVDGSVMSDSKVDGVIYRKRGNEYLRQAFDLTKSRTLIMNTVGDIRNMSIQNIILLKLGYYNKVSSKGYYTENDGGGAMYTISSDLGADDGFLTLKATKQTLSVSLVLEQTGSVSTKQAGVTGDGKTDDTKQLKVFVASLSKLVFTPHFIGDMLIKDKIDFDGTGITYKTLHFDCIFRSDFSGNEHILKFSNLSHKVFSGYIYVYGKGAFNYDTRTNYDGVIITNSFKLNIQFLEINYTKHYGLRIEKRAGDGTSNSFINIGFLRGSRCGVSADSRHLPTKIRSFENNGTSGSPVQYSSIVTDRDLVIEDHVNFIKIGNHLHQIIAKTGINTYNVFPCLSKDVVVNDTQAYFIYGGLLYTYGGDVSCLRIDNIDAINCGVGYRLGALYPGSVGNFTSQACGIAIALGLTNQSGAVGGNIDNGYFEVNEFDLVKVTYYPRVGLNINTTVSLDFSKSLAMSALQFTTNESNYRTFDDIIINKEGRYYGYSGGNKGKIREGNIDINFKPTFSSIETCFANNKIVKLSGSDSVTRLFGGDTTMLFVTGSGSNRNPTGSYTFQPSQSANINNLAAGESLVVGGMSYPTLFFIQRIPSSENWIIWWSEFDNMKRTV